MPKTKHSSTPTLVSAAAVGFLAAGCVRGVSSGADLLVSAACLLVFLVITGKNLRTLRAARQEEGTPLDRRFFIGLCAAVIVGAVIDIVIRAVITMNA